MFRPLRCPNSACVHHAADPGGVFYWLHGRYEPKCRPYAIQRFKCRACHRSFSRQTFRQDYRDHKPDLNTDVLLQLCSGTGLRQTARIVGTSRSTVTRKFYKISLQLGLLNQAVRRPVDFETVTLLMDEFESYESRRNTRPVTIPMMIELESDFIIDSVAASIRPRGKMTEARKRAIALEEQKFGRREDHSRDALKRVLKTAATMFRRAGCVEVRTDEKSSYPGLIERAFGRNRLNHRRTNSRLVRDTHNPLFRINHAEAMSRDLNGRLRRNSWLVSKRREYLSRQLELYMAHKNFVRPRFNRDSKTPAEFLGLADRKISPHQLLAWRQDLGSASVHPFDLRGTRLAA